MKTKTWQRSAAQKIIPYSHAGLAGCVSLQRSNQTGTIVGVYNNQQAGVDNSEPWSTVCEDHGFRCFHSTLKDARHAATDPLGWCEKCQAKEEKL